MCCWEDGVSAGEKVFWTISTPHLRGPVKRSGQIQLDGEMLQGRQIQVDEHVLEIYMAKRSADDLDPDDVGLRLWPGGPPDSFGKLVGSDQHMPESIPRPHPMVFGAIRSYPLETSVRNPCHGLHSVAPGAFGLPEAPDPAGHGLRHRFSRAAGCPRLGRGGGGGRKVAVASCGCHGLQVVPKEIEMVSNSLFSGDLLFYLFGDLYIASSCFGTARGELIFLNELWGVSDHESRST